MPEYEETVSQLVKLGFTSYQAKVYSSLVSIGVGSVSEIHHHSKVPRTKIYETLDELIRQGAVELQAGRPVLYKAVHPNTLVKRLSEEYMEYARKAGEKLEKSYHEAGGLESDLAWTVKGGPAVRRKLAEIVTSASRNVTMLETYPPSYALSVAALLRAMKQRGLDVAVISVIRENQPVEGFPESGLVEYRVFRKRVKRATDDIDGDVMSPLMETLSSPYGVAVVDREKAFVIIPNPSDESRTVGLSARIPGVPTILGVTIQRHVTSMTNKVRT